MDLQSLMKIYMTWSKVIPPKKIQCRYPLRSGWAKFYTTCDDLKDITNETLFTNSLNNYPYKTFYITEHGWLTAFDGNQKFPQILTDFSGDIIFFVKGVENLTFLAKIKKGYLLTVFHFPQPDKFLVYLDEDAIKEMEKFTE